LVRDAHHLGPQYLVCSVRKAKHTRLGYKNKLSMLCSLDLPLALAVPRGDHLIEQTPKQELDHKPQGECRYLKQVPPMTALRNVT
jgi:hypothetical protein